MGKAHLRVSETEVQSAVIGKKAKSRQEQPVLEKGPSPAESFENSSPLHGPPAFLPYTWVAGFPRSIRGPPKFFCDPFTLGPGFLPQVRPHPSFFSPQTLLPFSECPEKDPGGPDAHRSHVQSQTPSDCHAPGVIHTHASHGGPRGHLMLGNIPNGPLRALSRSVNSRLSAE